MKEQHLMDGKPYTVQSALCNRVIKCSLCPPAQINQLWNGREGFETRHSDLRAHTSKSNTKTQLSYFA